MEPVLFLTTLGAVLDLDHIMLGQFMVSQPLVVGAVFGGLLGDVPTGLLAGALVQLIWLSVIPVGAYIPSDYSITGGVASALAVMFIHQYGLSPAPALTLALALAIPAGTLAGVVDIWIRRLSNDRLARKAEAMADRGLEPPLGWFLFLALLPSYAKAWLIYWLWLGPGAAAIKYMIPHFPAGVTRALDLAFWALPALAFGVAFELSARDRLQWWFLGALALLGPVFFLWPQQRWLGLAAAVAAGSVLVGVKNPL